MTLNEEKTLKELQEARQHLDFAECEFMRACGWKQYTIRDKPCWAYGKDGTRICQKIAVKMAEEELRLAQPDFASEELFRS